MTDDNYTDELQPQFEPAIRSLEPSIIQYTVRDHIKHYETLQVDLDRSQYNGIYFTL